MSNAVLGTGGDSHDEIPIAVPTAANATAKPTNNTEVAIAVPGTDPTKTHKPIGRSVQR